MTNNALSLIPVAACPQLPYEVMREPREDQLGIRQPAEAIDILAVSDNPMLGIYLSRLFQKPRWTIAHERNCAAATGFARKHRAAVAVCETLLPDGSWHDLAHALARIAEAPALVVIGDDKSLVHEVLALGGFDALIRPLRETDVVWTLASAWHAWMKRFADGGTSQCSSA